ncbi:2-alkenal reductase [candidate division LCP-89 bacterium B3_LCP]|uniref:2-alkenal reductase n=1 Tax=candidate division LCP-89 bacterium B3_LCP TaxID=2012998 RepID=A0A532UZ73_UNCL8|nr:MAG: 2-alkenal reductase [candidate division LCP-89 bacterium B3_LCP]
MEKSQRFEVKLWRDITIGFLIGAVVILGFREYFRSQLTAGISVEGISAQENPAQTQGTAPIQSSSQYFAETVTESRNNAITRAIKEVAPAVVGINVTQVREYRSPNPFWNDPFWGQFFRGRNYQKKVENLGSGFIISPDGLVITNEHVVHNATEILVTMEGGEQYHAQIVGADYYSDIALLQIHADNLPYAKLSQSDEIIIGEWVIALGNPFGLFTNNDQPTATVGVVSATDRDFNRTSEGRIYKNMIQTDASINRGNSGGPLVNAEGEVIGMATMIFTEGGGSLGIGFATPVYRITEIVEALQEAGGVNRNYWTGLSIQNLDRLIALSMKLNSTDGVIVTDVETDSPGEKAGFQVADIIIAINNQKVTNYNAVRTFLENEDLKVGDLLNFTIKRDGKNRDLELRLEEMPR